jgi:hypothetical protein
MATHGSVFRRRPGLVAASLVGCLLLALVLLASRSCDQSPPIDTRPSPDPAPAVPRRPSPAPVDPLLPPVIQLEVNACADNDVPVELFGRTGAGGWYGGALTTPSGACNPDPKGRCTFTDLGAGPWVIRQGLVSMEVWLRGGTAGPTAQLDLPCENNCAVDLVVDADPECGGSGTLRLLPPVPLPADAPPSSGAPMTWTAGLTQRFDRFPCHAAAILLESASCRVVQPLHDPEGAPLRAVRLKLDPLSRVKLRFVDAETGAPIPGVTMVDSDYWTTLVSDANGLLDVIQQSRRKFMTAVLAAHHPDYQSTSVYPPALKGEFGVVEMQRREELRVVCEANGAPCPGHTQLFASFDSGPPTDPSEDPVGGGYVQGECTWDAPGRWRCERGRTFKVTLDLDGHVLDVHAPDGADTLTVDMSPSIKRGCLRGSWPSGDCRLELADAVVPVTHATELIPLPGGEGPVAGRVVCPEAVTWAEVILDRGGACAEPGPWAELAGICARPSPGPAVEDLVGGGCMLLDAASVMGAPPTYAASTPPLLETCPSWFPPGDYFIACGEGVAQPVTLVEGEVLEWALPAP